MADKHHSIKVYFLLALLVIAASCNKDEDHLPEPLYLADYEELVTINVNSIKSAIGFSGLDLPTDQLLYDVHVYKVTYKTNYKDQEVEASGLVAIPDGATVKGTLSFQHGTIAADRRAPSNISKGSVSLSIYGAFAAAGLVVVVPDFIGFGSSRELMHPYYVEELTASSVIDHIYASAELARILGLAVPEDLFLAGYSQGGYATMAVHKQIESEGMNGFALKASFPASGGYDVVGMRDFFFQQKTYSQPFFIAYVAEAYRVTYDWDISLSTFFNEPYATLIPTLFDGTLEGSEINALLTDEIALLVNNDYLDNTDDEKYTLINEAFEENSLTDWTPTVDMYMYHGDADITVPYQNSVDVFNGFDSDAVTFLSIVNGTHSTSFYPYLEDMANRLSEYID